MKVAHICLSNWFVDGVAYQENELVRQHVAEEHEVLVIASTETKSSSGKTTYRLPSRYLGVEGANVIRLPYRKWLPEKIMRKLRMNVGLLDTLKEFQPDTILFHGTCGWELRTVARYLRGREKKSFFIDSHEDWNNSARNFISREVLHRHYYGPVLRSVMGQVEKILCVSTEAISFVESLYRIPREKMEFYPLGGHPIIDEEYYKRRVSERARLGLTNDTIMFVQSGKQTKRKKLIEALEAFALNPADNLRMFIVGVLDEGIGEKAQELIARDSRVQFLGWKSPDQLTDLLCAADVYLQPGTQSATMQHSLSCRCAVILDDVPAHVPYQNGNGWFINGQEALVEAIGAANNANLVKMQENSFALAKNMLDYAVLSKRILS